MPHEEKIDIGEFTAHLRNVLLPMGLRVDDVRLSGQGLHMERSPFVITVPQPGKLDVFVSEASLAQFLETQSPAGLRKFEVEAKDGKLYVRAVKTVIVDLKANAVCSLVVQDGTKLMVALESVDMAGAGIKNLIESQLDKINPIFDTKDLPLNATIDSVTTDKGGVILIGSIAP